MSAGRPVGTNPDSFVRLDDHGAKRRQVLVACRLYLGGNVSKYLYIF